MRSMGCGVNCAYPTGSVADQIGNGGQCLTCHSADGADRFPEPIEQQSKDQNLKHGLAMIGGGSGAGESVKHGRKGRSAPRIVSSDQGSDQAVTLADCGRIDPPQIALAVTVTGCKQNAIALHVHHNGVDGALVALGIQSHAPHNIRACLIAVLN
jgi:hypothetical protein